MYNYYQKYAVTLVILSALGCSDDNDDRGESVDNDGSVSVGRIEPRPIAGCENESYLACNTETATCQQAIFSTMTCLRGNQGAVMPAARTISREEFGAELTADAGESTLGSEQLSALENGLVLVKLLKTGDLTGSGFVDSQKETVPAFYDADTDTVTFVRRDNGSLMETGTADLVLAHEYVHALQDQEHDLNRLMDEYGATTDSLLAFRSVFEGEASMHEDRFFAAVWGMDEQKLDREVRYTQQEDLYTESLAEYSPLLAIQRSFPYYAGGLFVYRAFTTGGMPQVRKLYAEPPTSTLEIRTGTPAIPVVADPPAPPSGYELLTVDTLGSELFFDFVQATFGNSTEVAAFRNEWRGDRAYLYYRPGTADVAVLWRIKLPNEAPRTQLRAAFAQGRVLNDDVLIVLTSDPDSAAIATALFDNVTNGNVVSPSAAQDDLVQAARAVLKPRLLPRRVPLR